MSSLSVQCVLVQENRAQRVRDNKLNKSLSFDSNGEVECDGDAPAVASNGDAHNHC